MSTFKKTIIGIDSLTGGALALAGLAFWRQPAALITAAALVIAAGAILVHLVRAAQKQHEQLHVQACQVEHARAQLEAQVCALLSELEQIRARRHTHATTEMLEDLAAVGDDLERETKEFYRYMIARIKNHKQILAAGRPGPYSYEPATTENRPARPGAVIKPWANL